jgi:hypothetical protein
VQVILPARERVCEVAEERRRFVALLGLALRKIDTLGEKSARRAGLEPLNLETQFAQAVTECRNGIAKTATGLVSQTEMQQAPHESAGRDYHRAAIEAEAEIGFHALDSIFPDHEPRDISLLHIQSRLTLEEHLHAELIRFLVALRSRSPDARALGGIQHAELNASRIGVQPHRSAEGIDLTDHVALCQTSDRRITGHLPNGVGILCEQEGFAAQAGRSHRGFYACMAGPDDDDIVIFWVNEVAQITGS